MAAAVAALLTAVETVTDPLLTAVTDLLGAVTLIGTITYFALTLNEEGTLLSGRKLIAEGVLRQKAVYTALVPTQSVHSIHNEVPFTAAPFSRTSPCFSMQNPALCAERGREACLLGARLMTDPLTNLSTSFRLKVSTKYRQRRRCYGGISVGPGGGAFC